MRASHGHALGLRLLHPGGLVLEVEGGGGEDDETVADSHQDLRRRAAKRAKRVARITRHT